MPRPDEGLIHAWLDGQLPPEEAARVEQLAATDPEWGAAVAEARGLIAASSRILSSLDHVPAGVIPQQKTREPVWRMPWWAKVAAAVVVVAGGSVMVFERANVPEVVTTPATQPADIMVGAPSANAPTTVQAPVTAAPVAPAPVAPAPVISAPAGKKSPPTVTPAAPRVAAAESKGGEHTTRSPAASVNAVVADARQKAEGADRTALATSQMLMAKDVATKAAEAAPRAAAPATPDVGGVAVTGAGGGVAMKARAAEPASADVPTARRVSGVAAAPAPTSFRGPSARCYRVRDPNASADLGVVMRMTNADGDTLRMESAQGTSGLRAWIVWRDGVGHGAMTAADGKGAVAIVATQSACPTP